MKKDVLILQLKELMHGADFWWVVCGGYALDLFLNEDIRLHGDVDLCVSEKDRDKAVGYFLQQGWNVYEYCGWGKVRPAAPGDGETGRNIMCVLGESELVRFYPCEESGYLYHEFFHTGITELNFLDVLFGSVQEGWLEIGREPKVRRALEKTVLYRDGVPYLAPEIALLFKAKQGNLEEYRRDRELVYSHLNMEQRVWLEESLEKVLPADG